MSPRSTLPLKPAKSACPVRSYAGVAKAVVGGALVRVAQHLVGLAGFLELLFRGMVAGIAVRVIFQRLLAIGALQLLVAHIPRNAQNFVVIGFAHSCIVPFVDTRYSIARLFRI